MIGKPLNLGALRYEGFEMLDLFGLDHGLSCSDYCYFRYNLGGCVGLVDRDAQRYDNHDDQCGNHPG